jgi:sugar transferase (PEP-CTERM/EpsH1 system associated)
MSRPVNCQLVHGLPIGGTEVLVDRLVRRLADRFEFVIACLDQVGELGEQLKRDGFEIIEFNRRPGFDWSCVRRLAKRFQAGGVQAVHAHQYTPFAYAAATRLLGYRPRLVFTEHGRFFPDLSSTKRRWFNRVLTSRRDRLIAVGEAVRQALIRNEGMSAAQIEIIHNGVEQSPARLSDEERVALRTELGAANDDLLVIQVARLDTIKDHATALKAFGLAAAQRPQLRLAIVGDGPERGSIERQIAASAFADRISLVGQRRDVPRLLAAADVFLLTSLSEGIPVTVIEAMIAGLPIIATQVGGVPEVVDGAVGMLAPAGDAERIAAAIVKLSDDGNLRQNLGESGRRRVAERFSEDEMVRRYDRVYAEVLQRQTRTSHALSAATT